MKKTSVLICLMLCALTAWAQPELQKRLQRQLIMAEDGSVIDLEEGVFALHATLSLEGKKNITLRGKGIGKTILSFKGQTQGAEGIKISNAENITIEDLTVQNAKGDGIKTMNVRGITFRRVKTEWTQISRHNGGYGLYPVLCQGVIIEACEAVGASDAGIYVGQSQHITVKGCKAHHNVAGIEIENSLHADVFENEAYENTGGILVFDLPDLEQKRGGNVRVYRNYVHHNNYPNFAPKGNIVAKVPAGTGVMILATSHVEVFENRLHYNNSIGTSIVSYHLTENPIKDTAYYPYPTNISVHSNDYRREAVRFQGKGRLGLMFRYKLRFGKQIPDIIYDGILDDKRDKHHICLRNNGNARFANIDAAHNFKNISYDTAPYDCEGARLEGNSSKK